MDGRYKDICQLDRTRNQDSKLGFCGSYFGLKDFNRRKEQKEERM
jgi:hypothetical protein